MNLVIQEKNFIWTLESQKRLWFYFLFDSVFLKDIREYLKKKKNSNSLFFEKILSFLFLKEKNGEVKKNFGNYGFMHKLLLLWLLFLGRIGIGLMCN